MKAKTTHKNRNSCGKFWVMTVVALFTLGLMNESFIRAQSTQIATSNLRLPDERKSTDERRKSLIITVLKQSSNTPTYARLRISNKNSGNEVGLMNINAGTYWVTPKYPEGSYLVEVLEIEPHSPLPAEVKCEVRSQDALVGVYFDSEDQVRICPASKQNY